MDELASIEFTDTIDKIKITFAMLAALFIALIGIASHMSIQVLFLCAHLIPGYNLTFIDPSMPTETTCVSARALSPPCPANTAPHLDMQWRNAVLPLMLFYGHGR
jgi:hypothetical protein